MMINSLMPPPSGREKYHTRDLWRTQSDAGAGDQGDRLVHFREKEVSAEEKQAFCVLYKSVLWNTRLKKRSVDFTKHSHQRSYVFTRIVNAPEFARFRQVRFVQIKTLVSFHVISFEFFFFFFFYGDP